MDEISLDDEDGSFAELSTKLNDFDICSKTPYQNSSLYVLKPIIDHWITQK
jgi:hypothetical protein